MLPADGLLAGYRGLDLTDEKGQLCGKILADMGADVIKVERPGGDRARNIGPFCDDVPHPERSLFWFAFNTGKRSITLNLDTEEGRELLRALIARADFLLESFTPGYLEGIGLGHEVLAAAFPGLIVASIAPFGHSGPYVHYAATDIVLMAMGGHMFGSGDADRPPVRIGLPQAYLHAGLHAAMGTLTALWERGESGEGQVVDVSIQEAVARLKIQEPVVWAYDRRLHPRAGPAYHRGEVAFRFIWPCKDGHVSMRLLGARQSRRFMPLIEWMTREGMADFLTELDWGHLDFYRMSAERMAAIEEVFCKFFATHTKEELWQHALEHRIMLCPLHTLKEVITEDPHLKARDYWVDVEHPELGRTIRYPGFPYRFANGPCQIPRRAPLIGEHNVEVYGELGVSRGELCVLREARII